MLVQIIEIIAAIYITIENKKRQKAKEDERKKKLEKKRLKLKDKICQTENHLLLSKDILMIKDEEQ